MNDDARLTDMAKMGFKAFDQNEDYQIDASELEVAMNYIYSSFGIPSPTLHIDGSDQLNFSEFKDFTKKLLEKVIATSEKK